jgi:hypothetical protein
LTKDSTLAEGILKDGKVQAKTGFFTTLNRKDLLKQDKKVEVIDGTTLKLQWKIPNIV